MTNVVNIPRQNAFSTTLTNSIDATETSITLDEALAFAIGSEPVYIVVDPKNNFREVMKITAGANPYTVTRGVADYDGGPSTAQVHSGGARVVLTNSWNYYNEMADAINSKADSDEGEFTVSLKIPVFADTAARDAAIPAPENGMECYITADGKYNDYTAGFWVERESGGTFPNATTAIAGKVELGTAAEVLAGTAAGGTGAALAVTPDVLLGTDVSKTSSAGAGDAGKFTRLDGSGLLDESFMPYTATAAEINQALDGISANVTAANLTTLTGGGDASALHSHSNIEQAFTAYEAVTANQAVALLPIQVEYFSQLTEADLALGDNNARRKYAVKVYPTRTPNFTTLSFRGRENGTSTALITVTIETDNAGSPSGTAVANGTAADLDSSTWTSTYGTRTATFPGVPEMEAGTAYWIVWSTNNTDAANYVILGVNSTYDENYITFERKTYDLGGASWGGSVTNATPFFWTVSERTSLGMAVVPTDANWGGRTWPFVGFAKANASAQASVQVYTSLVPNMSLPSGANVGTAIYLSETTGAITATPPNSRYGNSFAYKIGRFKDHTNLKIELGEKMVWGTISTADTLASSLITWFKPTYVEIGGGSYISGGNPGYGSHSVGMYNGSDNYSAYSRSQISGGVTGYTSGVGTTASFTGTGGSGFTGVGSAVTNVGFTYTLTDAGSGSSADVLWKAVQ